MSAWGWAQMHCHCGLLLEQVGIVRGRAAATSSTASSRAARRDYDWSGILPGDTTAALWRGKPPFEAMPLVVGPASGYVQSANEPPHYLAGPTPTREGPLATVPGDTGVAVIELGETVTARGALSNGNATEPGDAHVGDRLELCAAKSLRLVWRDRADIEAHLERREPL